MTVGNKLQGMASAKIKAAMKERIMTLIKNALKSLVGNSIEKRVMEELKKALGSKFTDQFKGWFNVTKKIMDKPERVSRQHVV